MRKPFYHQHLNAGNHVMLLPVLSGPSFGFRRARFLDFMVQMQHPKIFQLEGIQFLLSRRPRTLHHCRPWQVYQNLHTLRGPQSIRQRRLSSALTDPDRLGPGLQSLSVEVDGSRSGEDFPYLYGELRSSKIRLLRILPGRSNEPLACVLEQVALSTEPVFHSLSYCWGEPGEEEKILLNGRTSRVSKNLYEALRHFRELQDSESVFKGALWADAICINQENIDERSAQVDRMTQRYASAVRTIVWLGPNCSDQEDENIRQLFEKARSLGDWMREKDMESNGSSSAATFPLGSHVTQNIGTFYKLCKVRPWFKRTWIVQEVIASSKDPVLYSGRHRVELSELVRLYGLLIRENTPLVSTIVGRSGSQLQRLSRIRNSFSLVKSEDGSRNLTLQHSSGNPAAFLASLLIHFGGSKSTDPRDQIYGLLALSRAAGSLPSHLDVDYRLNYEEIYHRYATFLIQETQSLGLINCRRNLLTGVPTWVPDFRHIWAISFSTLHPSQPPRGAGRVSISDEGRILQVKGYIVGRCVKFVPSGSDVLPSENAIPEALTRRLRLVQEEIIQPASNIKGIPTSVAEIEFMRSGRFNHNLWNDMQYRMTPARSSTEKTVLTVEHLAEERRIAVYTRAAFAILSDGRILRCYRRDSPMILPEDIVCVLEGARSPCILRPVGEYFQYLGNCRILDGRLWLRKIDKSLVEGKEPKRFCLV
jgi:hypothetical protein